MYQMDLQWSFPYLCYFRQILSYVPVGNDLFWQSSILVFLMLEGLCCSVCFDASVVMLQKQKKVPR